MTTQAVCETPYGHKYLLEPPVLSLNAESPANKRPRSAQQYKTQYANVLLSTKVVNTYKHRKSIAQEILAAKSLLQKSGTTDHHSSF